MAHRAEAMRGTRKAADARRSGAMLENSMSEHDTDRSEEGGEHLLNENDEEGLGEDGVAQGSVNHRPEGIGKGVAHRCARGNGFQWLGRELGGGRGSPRPCRTKGGDDAVRGRPERRQGAAVVGDGGEERW